MMSVQATHNTFGEERARRYKAAMSRCPTARYLEILPMLCLAARPETRNATVVDLGSGTGYVADFFEGTARKVLRVDKSPDMLKASGSPNTIVSDMCGASRAVGENTADLLTCLASFHHAHVPEVPDVKRTFEHAGTRVWGPERHLDVDGSLQLHYDAFMDWRKILKTGGTLCLIDVPGYPDTAWAPFWKDRRRHTLSTREYHKHVLEKLGDWSLLVDANVFASLLKGVWAEFFQSDPHMQLVERLVRSAFSMKQLVESYGLPESALKDRGPMVPADFFDDVIDGYGAQRHFGFFPRETSISEALRRAKFTNVFACTLPTPWLFRDRREAAWFVHELFGLGSTWEFDTIPEGELKRLAEWLDHYLGFYKDRYGRMMLYWQLAYFVGKKQ
jgi:SAM-dependent methyltransferase